MTNPSSRSDFTPEPGQMIGQFELGELLGQGNMGAVYKAMDSTLQRQVAIKFLTLDRNHPGSSDLEMRFVREAHLMARINHPNIVRIYQAGLEAPAPYFVMELVPGVTLTDYLEAHGPLDFPEICMLGKQIASALRFAWESQEVIHRDLKPDNVLYVTAERYIKILDLGIAKCLDDDLYATTVTGMGIGTPYYGAPEQIVGDINVDHRCDIYALGIMLWEMVTHRDAFVTGANLNVLLASKMKGPAGKLKEIGRGCPTRLRRLIEGMIHLDPKKRIDDYATIEDVLSDAASRPVTASVRPPPEDVQTVILEPEPELVPPASTWSRRDSSHAFRSSPAEAVNVTRVLPRMQHVVSHISDGLLLGQYLVGERIGLGGMGVVHRVLDERTGQEYAAKFLISGDTAADARTLTILDEQARQLQRLRHAAIVTVIDFVQASDCSFLVSDLFLGPQRMPVNLVDYSRDFGDGNGVFAEEDVAPIFINLLDALAHAHDRGILHGNIKPQNVLFECVQAEDEYWSAQLKLSDFGLCRMLGEKTIMDSMRESMAMMNAGGPVTADVRALMHTYDHMSPEQKRGEPATTSSDIYAIGLMLYRLLTGYREPVAGKAPSILRPGINRAWNDIIEQALMDDPDDRFISVRAMASALEPLLME